MLRRLLGSAAVGVVILAWPSFAVGQQSEPLRRLRNHIHQDMTTCIAFFRLVSRCLAKNSQYAKAAAAYARATDDLLYKAILLGKQIGISDDDAKSRLGRPPTRWRSSLTRIAATFHRCSADTSTSAPPSPAIR